jgi:hypothetical protein
MQTICRLYATEQSALDAWNELKRNGFSDSHVFRPSRKEDGTPDADANRIQDDLVKAYVWKSDAAIYARHIGEGLSLVVVHAPFTGGLRATNVLNRYGPKDAGLPASSDQPLLWNEATPLSSALRWPVLAKNEHPFETLTGIPSLVETKEDRAASVRPDNPAPFSSMLGLPLLIDCPTPFSSLFKLPVLQK